MKVFIHIDGHPVNPRELDNVGTMVCWHKKYCLGDEQPTEDPYSYFVNILGIQTLEENVDIRYDQVHKYDAGNQKIDHRQYLENKIGFLNNWLHKKINSCMAILPIYMMDHSGITLSTSKFSCQWDSGLLGYIYCTKDRIREIYNIKCVQKTKLEHVEKILQNEVKAYSHYVSGEVYGFTVENETGNILHSSWGFYGDDWNSNGIKDHLQSELHDEEKWQQ